MKPYSPFSIVFLAVALLPSLLVAGWEDIDVSKTPPREAPVVSAPPARTAMPQPTRRPAPAPIPYAPPSSPMSSDPLLPPDLYSAHLDPVQVSDSWYRARLSLPASLDNQSISDGDISLLEFDFHFGLWDFRNIIGGDLSIGVDPSATIFTDDADLDLMPSFLVTAPVDVNWIWRYLNGTSFELGAAPGIYTDIDALGGGMFSCPFHVCFYYAVDPTISLQGGVEIRPGWGETAMPLFGLAWRPNDQFRLEVGAPRSMAQLQLGAVGLYGLVEWNNRSFNMDGDKEKPDMITLNDWRLGGGLTVDFSETCRLTFEAGYLFERSIEVEGDAGEDELDVDPAPFFGVLFGSEF